MFTLRQKVMFQHCDPAGIVFYPRYFEMLNATVEEWFDDMGVPFAALHGARGLGVPTARIAVTFAAPSRLGDVLDLHLTLTRIGGSSADLAIVARCDGATRLKMSSTLVCVSLPAGRPVRWPADLRAAMTDHLDKNTENT